MLRSGYPSLFQNVQFPGQKQWVFFVFFHVHVCVHTCVYAHVCGYMCMNSKARRICGVSFFIALHLNAMRHDFSLKLILEGKPACQQAVDYPSVSMTRAWGYRNMQSCLDFHVGAGNLNSGPHLFKAKFFIHSSPLVLCSQ